MRAFPLLLVLVLGASAGGACAKARAETEPVLPELVPPPPPPRLIEPFYGDPVPTIEPGPVESALAVPPAKPARPASPRVDSVKSEAERLDAEKIVTAPPPLTLEPLRGATEKTEASIRALLDRASRDLQRVNYPRLDADGRAQFDIARRFMQQAEEALKSGNLPFAGKLADKAAIMAAVLVR
ncbi:MAG: hypothetical protein ACT4QD_09990 [Acidobacteriota bacterium]